MKTAIQNSLKLSVVSIAAALLLSGCENATTNSSSNPTDVTVERGKVYDAIVTDANGQVATQKSNKNVYTFKQPPVYPITATGGWIDVDNDGNMTKADVELDLNLTSYSNIITPITTYIADKDITTREKKLAQLSKDMNCTKDDLLKVPSLASDVDVLLAVNAIYKTMKDFNATDIHSTEHLNALKDNFKELTTVYHQSGSEYANGDTKQEKHKNIATWLEKDIVMAELHDSRKVRYLDEDRINKFKEKHKHTAKGDLNSSKKVYYPEDRMHDFNLDEDRMYDSKEKHKDTAKGDLNSSKKVYYPEDRMYDSKEKHKDTAKGNLDSSKKVYYPEDRMYDSKEKRKNKKQYYKQY